MNLLFLIALRLSVLAAGQFHPREVIETVSDTDNFYYPVVGENRKLIGAVTPDGIRKTFATQALHDWLVAPDIGEPIVTEVTSNMPLSEAFDVGTRPDAEHLPVVASGGDDEFIGVLGCRAAQRSLGAEVLARQQEADSASSARHT